MAEAVSTVVINLDGDADRLAHIRRELERAGLPFERFPAIHGEHVPPELAPYFPQAAPHPILSRGEIGCYASHLAVCRRIASGELGALALVLEDDVILADDFPSILRRALKALPRGWDVVRLSNDTKHACLSVAGLGRRKLVRYSNVPVSAGATLWSRRGAEKFVRRRQRMLPVDQDLRLVWHWGLDTFGVAPAPVLRDRCGPSRIDAMAPDGWRGERTRTNLVRQARRRDVVRRHLHGVKVFGMFDWVRAEAINLVARGGGRVIEPLVRS